MLARKPQEAGQLGQGVGQARHCRGIAPLVAVDEGVRALAGLSDCRLAGFGVQVVEDLPERGLDLGQNAALTSAWAPPSSPPPSPTLWAADSSIRAQWRAVDAAAPGRPSSAHCLKLPRSGAWHVNSLAGRHNGAALGRRGDGRGRPSSSAASRPICTCASRAICTCPRCRWRSTRPLPPLSHPPRRMPSDQFQAATEIPRSSGRPPPLTGPECSRNHRGPVGGVKAVGCKACLATLGSSFLGAERRTGGESSGGMRE
jgi:hypothetical protein